MRTPWRRATDPRQSGFLIEDDANVLAVADVLSVTMAWLPRPSLYRPARRGASFVREGFDRPAPVGCLQPCRDDWLCYRVGKERGRVSKSERQCPGRWPEARTASSNISFPADTDCLRHRPWRCLSASIRPSTGDRVIDHQYHDRSNHRDHHAVYIEAGDPARAHSCEDEAPYDRPDDAEYDVEEEAFAGFVHDFAGDETRDQP